ncbi:MAG: putative component of membrane protein insertase Oxa1/YidC/SpoIIIJ protein YidD [Cyclobacteriaceae bacterium]
MKIFLTFILLIITLVGFSQVRDEDQLLIDHKFKNTSTNNNNSKGFLFAFYKNNISKQILNDCIYDHSCSQFSHDVFKNFGIIKGIFLTTDRLTRCNRASFAEMTPARIDIHGKAIDHWDDYEKSE